MPFRLFSWSKHNQASGGERANLGMADVVGFSGKGEPAHLAPDQLAPDTEIKNASRSGAYCQIATQATQAVERIRQCNMLYTSEEQRFIQ